MGYELMGRLHAGAMSRFESDKGQGTVEYVGLILLIAVLIAGVVQASNGFKDTTIAEAVVDKIESAIKSVDMAK